MRYHYMCTIWACGLALAGSSLAYAQDVVAAEAEVRVSAHAIWRAVQERKADAIMEFIGEGGIPCLDGLIERERVIGDMKNQSSRLFTYLFAPDRFRALYADALVPMSMAEYFAREQHPKLRVDFARIRDRVQTTYACVRFTPPVDGYSPELCFSKEGKRWILADCLYPCG